MRVIVNTNLISVPIVGLRVEALLLIGLHQLFVVVHSHGAAHDLPNARHQKVHRLRQALIIGALIEAIIIYII